MKIFRRFRAVRILRRALWPAALVLTPIALRAQTLSTVREVEFRSRWSNYHVDQPQTKPAAEDENGGGSILRSLFKTGPIVLRGSVTNGWEFSNARLANRTAGKGSDNSFFTAPAVSAEYDRARGPWDISFRYSAGYLRYLDRNYAPDGGGGAGGLTQTAGLNLARQGSRLTFRTSASASAGTGFDLERNRQTDRKSISAAISGDYSLTEFTRSGASFNVGHQTYSGATGGLDDAVNQWAGTIFGESVLTGKTGFRFELGAGQDSQTTGNTMSRDRNYFQGVLRLNYQPTAKLTFTPAVGFGSLQETGQSAHAANGLRTIYSLGVDYVPTEKTAIHLFAGLEGSAAKPELSLTLNWHPRQNTSLYLSAYQQAGLSTISEASDQTRRGILATGQQRLFQRMTVGLGAGWEQEVLDHSSLPQPDPYYFLTTTLGWEFNSWLMWQAQYRFSSGRYGISDGRSSAESRASTSFQLTF